MSDTTNQVEAPPDERREALATMILGGVLVVIGVVVIVQAAQLDNRGETIGPSTLPWVIGVLLPVVGVALVLSGRQVLTTTEGRLAREPQDWARLGLMLAAVVVFAVVISFLGYVVSATLLFGVTAIVLGAPYRLRSFAYGFCVAAAVFLVFDVGIGISLPAGPWGF